MYGRKKTTKFHGNKGINHMYILQGWRPLVHGGSSIIVLQFNGGHNSHTVERNLFAQKKMRIWEV